MSITFLLGDTKMNALVTLEQPCLPVVFEAELEARI
jgi:hypothetical protein